MQTRTVLTPLGKICLRKAPGFRPDLLPSSHGWERGSGVFFSFCQLNWTSCRSKQMRRVLSQELFLCFGFF